jgi:uncharacterized protein (DUF1800 family)
LAALGTNLDAAIAFNRFGLGGRPDDVIPDSVTGWLTDQLIGPDPCMGLGMPTTAFGLAIYTQLRGATLAGQPALKQQINGLLSSEIQAYLLNAITTKVPFRERLVQFWTNHFALMAVHASVNCCAGAYVREAIRPHVTGTFTDMLLAVMQHPCMLYNLNNTGSSGPQSPFGLQCSATGGCVDNGINENLARECLELHTVGINAGYTQADVDSLAILLTGWTTNLATAPRGFIFNPKTHQPGNQVLMGQTFEGSQAGGIAALTWLSTHPDTYLHLATELVTHFVSDTPEDSDIATVVTALSSTGGSLAAAATALVGLANAWVPLTKLRTPQDYVIAVLRAAGATANGTDTVSNAATTIMTLGQPVWQSTFPNGYSDLAADWASPAQMVLRTDWINALTNELRLSPATVMSNSLGPLLQPTTLAAVNAATSVHDQLSLVFLSPEFQRR